jgi:hypothetical protein
MLHLNPWSCAFAPSPARERVEAVQHAQSANTTNRRLFVTGDSPNGIRDCWRNTTAGRALQALGLHRVAGEEMLVLRRCNTALLGLSVNRE